VAAPLLAPRVKLAETGSTVRFDRWLASPDEYHNWEKRVAQQPSDAATSAASPAEPATEPAAADAPALTREQQRLAKKFGRRWHARACIVALPLTADGTWLCRLLLCEASQAIREEVLHHHPRPRLPI
jgi:hypothetical protein